MRPLIAALVGLLLLASAAAAQEPAPPDESVDVFDLYRKWRNPDATATQPPDDYTKSMKAFVPVIGGKPGAGFLVGVAGNVAFFRGDPSTTRISSVVASVTFSTQEQTAITERLTMFGKGDRWRLETDHRFQWTSQQTYALGADANRDTEVRLNFDFFRLHQTAYYQLRPNLFVGGGVYFDRHTNVSPDDDEEPLFSESDYLAYSAANGLPAESQTSAGTSFDATWDTRDSFINAHRGWLARAGYKILFDGFLGGSGSYQRVQLDVRTYLPVSANRRHMIALWSFADLTVNGAPPYFDLPATGTDTYGRSSRGYAEGRFRGERLVYGEIEYRGTLMRNNLLGMVAFLNTATITNLADDEHLFENYAPGIGAGLRLLVNKRSKTQLCFDVAFGKQGSKGIYLAVQEAF
jgi:outer membrane protein assembly factor BamA